MLYTYVRVPGRTFDGIAGRVFGLVAPVALGSLLLVAARWSLSRQVKLAAIGCATVVVLYGLELDLARDVVGRSAPAERGKAERTALQVAAESGVQFDTRTHAEVVMDLRARGTHAVLSLSPRTVLQEQPDGTLKSAISIDGIEVLPLGGIANRLSAWCNESGDYTFYTSDPRGFRNPRHIWRLSKTDIAVVGNSFAMGACMPPGKGFVDRIRRVHPATLNLAMGRDGPLLELATLREYLPHVRPRIVLWVYEEDDDLPHLKAEQRSPLLRRYLDGDYSQGLMARQTEIDSAMAAHGERELRLRLRKRNHVDADDGFTNLKQSLKLRRLRDRLDLNVWRGSNEDTVDTADLDLLREILRQAQEVTSSWHGTLVFVYLPAKRRYAGDVSPFGGARELVLDLVADLRIPVIDAHAVFQAHHDPLSLFPFRHFFHYTERGHDLVARQILWCISRREFLRTPTVCGSPMSTATR